MQREPPFLAEAGGCPGPRQTLQGPEEGSCPHQLRSPASHLLLLLLLAVLSRPALPVMANKFETRLCLHQSALQKLTVSDIHPS